MNYKKIPKVLIEIRPSKIVKNFIGLFAVRELKKGTIIGEAKYFKESFHPWKDFKNLDKQTQKKVVDYCVGTEKGFYAPDDFNYMSIPWHMNHSCDGNVAFDKNDNFITIKNVKEGEELSWDYGLTETNPNFKMKCSCRSKKCRKVITGNDWKFLINQPDKAIYMSFDLVNKKHE